MRPPLKTGFIRARSNIWPVPMTGSFEATISPGASICGGNLDSICAIVTGAVPMKTGMHLRLCAISRPRVSKIITERVEALAHQHREGGADQRRRPLVCDRDQPVPGNGEIDRIEGAASLGCSGRHEIAISATRAHIVSDGGAVARIEQRRRFRLLDQGPAPARSVPGRRFERRRTQQSTRPPVAGK